MRLSVDASMKGLGAAIIQDGGVVAYASKALTPTEQRYAQIEKEMLAVVFGCSKFHKLIYGKSDVVIESDHKPLESLMKKPIHAAPMRIQKMMLKLQPYEFELIYVSGKNIGLADCLSRIPQPGTIDQLIEDDLMVCTVETTAHSNQEVIARATREDEDLQMVMEAIKRGWPEKRLTAHPRTAAYWEYRGELSAYNGIVYRGEKICIPKRLRPKMLEIIHSSHMGIVKCKQRARDVIFWPGLNKQIEEVVSKCETCLAHRNKQQKEPMIIHPLPMLPWNKVGTDLFEIGNDHYLILVDYYSNFIEVAPLPNTSSRTVIGHIKANISRYGIMETLVSDNGPQYSCREFKEFMKEYNIRHVTSSPGHQQANGLAESAVKSVKSLIKKCKETGDDVYLALLDLRNVPRDDTLGSPAQRLMGRRTRTRLPTSEALLRPASKDTCTVHDRLGKYREKQKEYYDRGSKMLPSIREDNAVRIRTPQGWKPAEYVREHDSPNSHIVRAGDQARSFRRNRSDLLITSEKPHQITAELPQTPITRSIQRQTPPPANATRHETPATTAPEAAPTNAIAAQPSEEPPTHNKSTTSVTRSGRITQRPQWHKDYVRWAVYGREQEMHNNRF